MTSRRARFGWVASALVAALAWASAPAAGEAGDTEAELEREREYRRTLQEGLAFLARGGRNNLAEAGGRFRTALKFRPESALAEFLVGLALCDAGTYEGARSRADKAIDLSGGQSAEAFLLKGQLLLYMARDLAEAERLTRRARALFRARVGDPYHRYGVYLATFNLGRILYHRGQSRKDYQDAFACFEGLWSALSGLVKPDNDFRALYPLVRQAQAYRAYCLDALGRDADAVAVYREMAAGRPDDAEARLRLAAAYRRRGAGYTAEAQAALLDALRVDPNLYEADLQLAHLYATAMPPDRAQADLHLRRFLERAPRQHPWRGRAERYLSGDAER